MIISHSARVLFVHVQKTGGLSVEHLLNESLPDASAAEGVGGRHGSLERALTRYPQARDYFIFGFVRDPWARMYSWYAMIKRREQRAAAGDEHFARLVKTKRLWRTVVEEEWTFEDFVLRGTEQLWTLRTPQLDYLRTDNREADLIGRTETLDRDLYEVFQHAGLKWGDKLPRRNASPEKGDYREHYTEEMRDRVTEVFKPDIERFDYKF